MKDAKGHGSNKRGGSAPRVVPDKTVAGATHALVGNDGKVIARLYSEGSPAWREPGALAVAAAHGIPTAHLAPAPKQTTNTNAGPFKVQSLDTKRVGQPWATQRSFRNNTVAERVALRMAADGAHMRVKVR